MTSRTAPHWWKRLPTLHYESTPTGFNVNARTPGWIEHFTRLYRARRAWIAQGRPTDRAAILEVGTITYQPWCNNWHLDGWTFDGRHVIEYRQPTYDELVINGWSIDELRIRVAAEMRSASR